MPQGNTSQLSTSPPSARTISRRAGPNRFLVAALRPVLFFALVGKLIGLVIWSFASHPQIGAWFFFGPDPFVLYGIFAPSAQGLCRVFTRFATDRRSVWLTIDDGPDEHDTPRLLDLLDRHRARATFFVIGERAARHPHLIAEIVRRGHDIGHHTHTHPARTFWCASPRRLAAEFDDTLPVLQQARIRPRFFRAPVGIKHLLLHHALISRDLRYVGWSIRSGDCHSRSAEEFVGRTLRRLEPGAIILVHEGPSVPTAVRVRGLALLLDALAARGFTCEIPDAAQLR